jgi:hypothetical protein
LFGLFQNKDQKIAKAVSGSVLNTINGAFLIHRKGLGKPDHVSDDNKFIAPVGFFSDKYIVAFIHSIIGVLIEIELGGREMNPEQKGYIIFESLKYIAGENQSQLYNSVKEYNDYLLSGQSDQLEYELGSRHGYETASIVYGFTDKINQKSKAFSETMQTTDNPQRAYSMFVKNTLAKHIKEHYLS